VKIINTILLCICLFFAAEQSHAQRIWAVLSEPSNELTGVQNKVTRGWLCYSSRTGRLQSDCPVTFKLSESIGGPGVLETCIPNSSGRIDPLTCGNGGHTHGEDDRPVIFEGTEVRYFGDTNPEPLEVNGDSPISIFLAGFTWAVPQAGGFYTFDSSMTAPLGSFFVSFAGGVLFLDKTLESIGLVNVTHARDSLRQLPDAPGLYNKARNGPNGVGTDMGHKDEIAYAATAGTRLVLPLIAIEYTTTTMGLMLSFNDISLPKGGVNDFKATTPTTGGASRWADPHKTHREGQDTDVNRPGGPSAPGCGTNKTVEYAVDKLLAKNTSATLARSAFYCERSGNFHIDTTRLRIAGKEIVL
jgi:hypothetical protein